MAEPSRYALRALPGALLGFVLNAVEAPMRGLQRLLGVPRIAWVFVAPNLVVLALFTFLPIVIDFLYTFTGGVQLYPSERPFTGLDNLATLFECGNYLDPSTCRKDLFWRAVYNTGRVALAPLLSDHAAAPDAESPRRAGPRAHSCGAGFRRDLRTDRRRAGFGDALHRPVHLSNGLCRIDPALRTRGGCVAGIGGYAPGAHAGAAQDFPARHGRQREARGWLISPECSWRRAAEAGSIGPIGSPTATCCSASC